MPHSLALKDGAGRGDRTFQPSAGFRTLRAKRYAYPLDQKLTLALNRAVRGSPTATCSGLLALDG